MVGELERFFRKYFEREDVLGAVCDQQQLFRMRNSGNKVLIDNYYMGDSARDITIGKDSSIFINPKPANLVKLVQEVYSPDDKVEIVSDEYTINECKYQLQEWRKKGDLRGNVNLTLEYKPTTVGDAELEKQLDLIVSEAETINKEFPNSDFNYPREYTLKVNGKPFIKFKRGQIWSGIGLDVELLKFRGTNKEIVKFSEAVDETAEECYSKRRG